MANENNRRKLNDLMAQRDTQLSQAQAAYDSNDQASYTSSMEQVTNLNTEIGRVQDLIREEDRYPATPPSPAEQKDAMEARVEALRRGDPITFDASFVRDQLRSLPSNSTTLANGNLVQPTGVGTTIRGADSAQSSIIDQVSVMDLTGLGGWEEPYVKAELLANAQKVAIAAGTLRVSSDPTFRIAKLSPYEVNVTSYVDRNIARLSPAAYDAKITSMAMRALRRAVISLIFNGDGQASPDFFGIKTAKNKDNEPIFKTVAVSGVNVDLLDDLVFAYGGDEEMGGNAALYLAKKDLKAIGRLRGTNEKQRLYKVASSPGNANTGTITDGGLIIPYALGSALTELTGATAGAEAIQTMLYGDPANFLLGLFGGFSIRIDESYKAAERMFTILGDVMVGGNLIADEGFVVATVPAAGG